MTKINCQHRYSSLWRWSDNTTALHYNISHCCHEPPPYCTAFYRSVHHLSVINCDGLQEVDFLCEIPMEADRQSQSGIALLEPENPASSLPGMAECHGQEATLQFLGCGAMSSVRSPDTTVCPHNTWDLDNLWFQCRDHGACVPYTLVCDHRPDCDDGSDEDFCSFEPCSSTQFECRDGKQVSAERLSHTC